MRSLLIGALGGFVTLAAALAAHAQTTIYDTFNTDEANLFDCCNVVSTHTGHTNPDGQRQYLAIPFVPPVDARITEIDLGLSSFSDTGGDGAWIQVMGSTAGFPGRIKHMFYLVAAPAGGQCCTFVSETATGIPVKAGGRYWIEVKPVGLADMGWNLNTIGATGAYAVKDKAWTMTDGTTPLPAVRIIGR